MRWRVTWEIDSDAETPEMAAMDALRAQRRAGSNATTFIVSKGSRAFVVDLTMRTCEQIPRTLNGRG